MRIYILTNRTKLYFRIPFIATPMCGSEQDIFIFWQIAKAELIPIYQNNIVYMIFNRRSKVEAMLDIITLGEVLKASRRG